ncbi:MAG: YlmH/Sll1252 family protein [Syntrophomonas sp.]
MNDYLNNIARTDEEKRLLARLNELVQKAVHGICGQSDFIDLRQQELARAVAVSESGINWYLNGGYDEAERKRLLVSPEWEVDPDTRIAYLRINHKKFKEQSIGHRDYMGAILNLGIKREKLGDIIVQNDMAYVIVDVDMVDFICQQLSRVKHGSVLVEEITKEEFIFTPPELTIVQLTLASLRLDAAIAGAYNLSRSGAENVIEAGNVKLNQMEIFKSSAQVKNGDLISVQGLGRFQLKEIGGLSRKGRYRVQISRW